MKTMKKETVVAWPKFDDEEIELVKKIYLRNWKHADIGDMIRRPYSGHWQAFKVLVLVSTNNCQEIMEDWHLYEELNNEICRYLNHVPEDSEEFKQAMDFWANLHEVKNMNKEG